MKITEVDAGLWELWIATPSGGSNCIGTIWDGGSKVAGETCRCYRVLDGWHRDHPGRTIRKFTTWIGAFNHIRSKAS